MEMRVALRASEVVVFVIFSVEGETQVRGIKGDMTRMMQVPGCVADKPVR